MIRSIIKPSVMLVLAFFARTAFGSLAYDDNDVLWAFVQVSENYAILDGSGQSGWWSGSTAVDPTTLESDKIVIPKTLIDEDSNKDFTIIGIGTGAFASLTSITEVDLSDTVITNIGESAFSGCTGLTTVKLPDTLISIDKNAFYECTNLGVVDLPDSVETIGESAFSGCSSFNFSSPVLGVKTIGDSAFTYRVGYSGSGYVWYGCTNLVISNFTAGNLNVGTNAFRSCSSVKSIKFEQSVAGIGSGAFYSCGATNIEFESTVLKLEDSAFSKCADLKRVSFFGNVEAIGSSAFASCSELQYVAMHGKVGSIGGSAFASCSKLSDLNIGNTVGNIANGAFSSCTSLKELDFVHSISNIEDSAFSGCSGLTNVCIHESIDNIGLSCFSGCSALKTFAALKSVDVFGSTCFNNCSSLTDVYFGGDVCTIESSAFYALKSLKDVCFNGKVDDLGSEAFRECDGLTNVVFNGEVGSVGGFAFYYCSKLKNASFRSDVYNISNEAFARCRVLEDLNLPNSITNIGERAFWECRAFKNLVIPVGVTEIPESMCYYCTTLTNIVFHNGITKIDDLAFNHCSALDATESYDGFVLPENIVELGQSVFSSTKYWNVQPAGMVLKQGYLLGIKGDEFVGDIDLSDTDCKVIANGVFVGAKITSIALPENVGLSAGMFLNCVNLTNVVMAANQRMIPSETFSECVSLKEFDFSSITNIGANAFKGSGLTSVDLAATAVVADGAFSECTNITAISMALSDSFRDVFPDSTNICEITIKPEVASIPENSYTNLPKLVKLYLPATVTSIGDDAFKDCDALMDVTIPLCRPVKEVFANTFWKDGFKLSITSGSTAICDEALANCNTLTSIEIPISITSIGNAAFSNCTALASLTLPQHVTTIGDLAFYNCTNLTSLIIPEQVTSIGSEAFCNCTALTDLKLLCEVPKVGDDIFNGISNKNFVIKVAPYNYGAYITASDYLSKKYWWPDSEVGFPVVKWEDDFPGYAEVRFLSTDGWFDNSNSSHVRWTTNYYVVGHAYYDLPTPSFTTNIEGEVVSVGFAGWYTKIDSGGTKIIADESIVTADTVLYARWLPPYAAKIDEVGYYSLNDAFQAVGTSTTNLIVLQRQLSPTTGMYRVVSDCKLDLSDKSIWTKAKNTLFVVDSGVEFSIMNGELDSTYGDKVIEVADGASLSLENVEVYSHARTTIALNGADSKFAMSSGFLHGDFNFNTITPPSANIDITGGFFTKDPADYLSPLYTSSYIASNECYEVVSSGFVRHVVDGGDLSAAVDALQLSDANAITVLKGYTTVPRYHVSLYNDFVDWMFDSTNYNFTIYDVTNRFSQSKEVLLAYVYDDRDIILNGLAEDALLTTGVTDNSDGSFGLTFTLPNVIPGDSFKPEMLNEVYAVQGSNSPDGNWSRDNVELDTTVSWDNDSLEVGVTVTPSKNLSSDSFFFRPCVK